MIYLILPAYNEEEALPPLLDAIGAVRRDNSLDLKAIIVDDGSADSTAEVVAGYDAPWVSLIRHPHNKGLSQAIQTGLGVALEEAQPDDLIITMDADNTQPPEHIIDMRSLIDRKKVDVVVASRFQPGAEVHGVPMLRRLYSKVMSILFQIILPIKGIKDYSCGYRAYRAEVIQRAYATFGDEFITEEGFACMVEILLQSSRLDGVNFGEVPMILRYDLKPTETRMNVTRTISETLKLALKHRRLKRQDRASK